MASPPRPTPFLGAFGWRLFLSLAVLSLLTAAAVGALAYVRARQALEAEAMAHMRGVARERRARLESWFDERLADMRLLDTLVEEQLARAPADSAALRARLELLLSRQGAYRRCLLLDAAGDVVAQAGATRPDHAALGQLPSLREAAATGEPALGPVALDPAGDPVMHLAVPISVRGRPWGALLAVMRPGQTIQPILADSTGLGRTGETYLVGADSTMLTPSRNMHHPPALTHKMPTVGVHAALAGTSGSAVYRGVLGEDVLGAWEWLPRQQWALMAEIGTTEAFAPLRRLARQIALLALAALLVALLLAVAVSRRLSRPLVALAEASERVAAGDLAVPSLPRGPGEIGGLGDRFTEMVAALARSREALARSGRELARAEQQAELGLLAGGLVHEMRNPLAAVKMNLSSLARGAQLDAVQAEQLALAREQGERLERMLGELLDYSRPVTAMPGLVVAAELAQQVDEASAAALTDCGVRLETALPALPLRFLGDRELLARALVNLVVNAAQAAPADGRVQLRLTRDPDGLVLEVTDRGRGMPPAVRERLFDPFFTTREEGVGLGMSVVKRIVDLHGGRLAVESDEGQGTRVRILIPEDGPAPGGTP
ncbi:MAG: sensor histidine kinase [Candidatus Latescibacteria bacterium]|nr:sensor histidine kinase [Candidatus Latescibacterota bacterium]